MEGERRNVRNLIRWVSGFVAWPSLTISVAFLLFDPSEHVLHIAGLLPLSAIALAVFFMAPKLAITFVPEDE